MSLKHKYLIGFNHFWCGQLFVGLCWLLGGGVCWAYGVCWACCGCGCCGCFLLKTNEVKLRFYGEGPPRWQMTWQLLRYRWETMIDERWWQLEFVNWKERLYPPGPEFIDLVTIWVNNLWIVVAILLLNSLLRALISKRFSLQKNIYQTALPLGCFHQEHVVHGFVWGCPLNIMGLFIQGVFEDLRCLLFKSCGW